MLRRLLIDNGGDIAKLWRMDERPGQLMIPDVDDLSTLPHYDGLAFASAETTDIGGGVSLSSLMLWKEEKVPKGLDGDVNQPRPMSVQQYAGAVCLVVNGRAVRRSDVITYVANKRGGSHYDRSRTGNPARKAAHELLDLVSTSGYKIGGLDAVFGQFLGIGRTVANSPDVLALCDEP